MENSGQGPEAWTTTTGASYSQPDAKVTARTPLVLTVASQRNPRPNAEHVVFEAPENSRFAGSHIAPAASAQSTNRPSSAKLRGKSLS